MEQQSANDNTQTRPTAWWVELFGLGTVTKNNPTGRLGFVTAILLMVVFFPLLLLSRPSQLPVLQVLSVVALVVEIYRYRKQIASKHEWKFVLAAFTAVGWYVFLHLG